ncbi:MAG: hypothetical protein JSU01_09155 [Bacteroidetes bacterium]|nr:hypothetical protein [Bacteroidota bacterium]
MTSELISIIANIALTLSLIVAVVFGLAQVRAAARDRKERLTLETLRTFQTREFASLALFISSKDLPKNRQEMAMMPADERAMIFQYGQEMEGLGMLVAEKLIDIDLVDKTLGSFVATTWEKYKPLFEDIRVNGGDPYMGEYFQWVAEEIQMEMERNPRKPFYKEKHPLKRKKR